MNSKQRRFIGSAVGILSITAFVAWMSPSSDEPTVVSNDRVNNNTKTLPEPFMEPVQSALPVVAIKTRVPTSDETTDQIFMTLAVQAQMADIAHAYEANMRFPKYSKPLNANDWNLLNPRPFVERKVPLDFNESISAAIVLKHYIAHDDQDLEIEVHISGMNESQNSIDAVEAYLSFATNQQRSKLNLSDTSEGTIIYRGILSSEQLSQTTETESTILSDIHFSNGETAKVSARFKIVGTDARLTTLDSSYVDGAHLMIPATFDVAKKGYYRIQANLFDQASNTPITHINTAFMLDESNNEGTLKVHASTLRHKGYAGPYVLKDFNITRGPAHPGDQTGYGQAEQEAFVVDGHYLSGYDDEEYVDPKNQQRLEFLQRMAGVQ